MAPRSTKPVGEAMVPATTPHRRLRLGTRLALLLGAAATFLAIGGALLGWSLAELSAARDQVVNHYDPSAVAARDLRAAMVDQETGLRGYALTRDRRFFEPFTSGRQDAAAARARLDQYLGEDRDLRGPVRTVESRIDAWENQFAAPTIRGVNQGDPNVGKDIAQTKGRKLFDSVRAGFDQLDGQITAHRRAAVANLNAAASRVTWVAIGLALGVVVVGALVAAGLAGMVIAPLRRLGAEVETVTAGDLDHAVHGTGPPEIEELAANIDAMRQRLRDELLFIEQQSTDLTRSNTDLEQFAYVASHDLQEPLRKITGFCQLLEKRYAGQLDERADEYIHYAVDGAKRMQDLINDLLAFSRVGRTTEQFVPVALAEVVDTARANLSTQIDETGARIEVQDDLPTVDGDPRLLTALFQNLISNAVKFRSEEAPRVTIRAESGADGLAAIAVTDNGIGIDPEHGDQIFTIFKRLHTRSEYDGTGIGLALSKKIAEYHGGTLRLESGVPPGATFVAELPVHTSPGSSSHVLR